MNVLGMCGSFGWSWISLVGFRSLVEEESTCWALVNLFNLQNELMDVHQSDISKMPLFSTSNLVSFMFIKSCRFTCAYHVLLHKTRHTTYVLFFIWFLRDGSRERAHLLFVRGEIVRGITITISRLWCVFKIKRNIKLVKFLLVWLVLIRLVGALKPNFVERMLKERAYKVD